MKEILKSKNSITLYKMPDQLINDDGLLNQIMEKAFKPIKKESLEDTTSGWCDPVNMSDTEYFTNSMVAGSHVYGLRIDSYSYPKKQLDPIVDMLELDRKRTENIEHLPKWQKKEIKDQARARIKMNTLPGAKNVPVVFDFQSRHIIVFSQSKGDLEQFTKVFESTFTITPIAENLITVDMEKFKTLNVINKEVIEYCGKDRSTFVQSIKAANQEGKLTLTSDNDELERIVTNDYFVESLTICNDDEYSFEITDKGQIKNIDIEVSMSMNDQNELIAWKCEKLVECFNGIKYFVEG